MWYIHAYRLLPEEMLTEKPRHAVRQSVLKISRKLRFAGRVLKNIPISLIGRGAGTALYTNFPHPTLPLQDGLTKKRRYRKAWPRIILNHHKKISKITEIRCSSRAFPACERETTKSLTFDFQTASITIKSRQWNIQQPWISEKPYYVQDNRDIQKGHIFKPFENINQCIGYNISDEVKI